MINDKMIHDNNTLNEFLKDSPYTDEQKQELTLWLDGLIIAEPNEQELKSIKRFD